ncbi:MAG: hypothetical protein M1829_000959 [Trizodia sp. TS-e1964]|nr:MAG: hypothetical protein M1829_000959 [Trizodia sp. TS-e1964]
MNTTSFPGSASTTTTTSTSHQRDIRPRNRRLISTLEEDSPPSSGAAHLISPLILPNHSRAPSPIPSKYPSRAATPRISAQSTTAASSTESRPLGGFSFGGGHTSPTNFATELWDNSWSSLQGIASSVLGNDTIEEEAGDLSNGRALKAPRKKKALEPLHRRTVSNAPPSEWGPTGWDAWENSIGSGTAESRAAQVRAKRREDMLAADAHNLPDSMGRYKRRSSTDLPGFNGDAESCGEETLVYVHRVQPQDTLAGVIIQFNCDPSAFRKANRFWPNDSIQTRKYVILPVDACAIKGRPVPEILDMLDEDNSDAPLNSHPFTSKRLPPPLSIPPSSSSFTAEHHADPPWKHESWIMLPHDPQPIEIARLPLKSLNYFPLSRRKSNTLSTLSPPTISLTPSPRPSIDQARPSHSSSPSSLRPPSSSIGRAAFSLTGPGGVGTLDANVRRPGPAQDGLNKYFAAHLPLLVSDPAAEPPRSASPALGLDAVGFTIEGWVRKLASRAVAAISEAGGSEAGGDLIELEAGIEGGEGRGVEGEGDGHGAAGAATGIFPGNEPVRQRGRVVDRWLRGALKGASRSPSARRKGE